jgi:NADP-dependent 3-hydroxy acid dehydrogenase YdfG
MAPLKGDISPFSPFLGHSVSQEEQWESVVRQTRETFRRIDVLVKDAGIYLIEPVAETTL